MVRTNIKKSETREMIKNLIGWTLEEIIEAIEFDTQNNEGKKFHNCNAETYDRTLVSYGKPVAIRIGFIVIELGKYSTSTSKQVTKWAEESGCEIYNISYKFDELRKGVI